MRRTLLGLTAGLAGFVLAGELVFRVLPVSTATMTGYYIDPHILTYPAGHSWTVSTGWDLRNAQRLTSNNLGFASDRPFVKAPQAVALIGDSYVESSMLPAPDRPGARLETLLNGTRPVYAMGAPGSSLLDYAERVRYAYQVLGVRDFVILLEPGDLRQSLCGSNNVHGVCLSRDGFALRNQTLPPASPMKKLLRHSALAQYLVGQIRANPLRFWQGIFARSVPSHAASSKAGGDASPEAIETLQPESARMVDAVADAFIARIHETAPTARLLVLADGRRGPAHILPTGVASERRRFLEISQQRGLTVLDGEASYARHLANSKLSLAVGPYDAHLNALGVELLLTMAADALR